MPAHFLAITLSLSLSPLSHLDSVYSSLIDVSIIHRLHIWCGINGARLKSCLAGLPDASGSCTALPPHSISADHRSYSAAQQHVFPSLAHSVFPMILDKLSKMYFCLEKLARAGSFLIWVVHLKDKRLYLIWYLVSFFPFFPLQI